METSVYKRKNTWQLRYIGKMNRIEAFLVSSPATTTGTSSTAVSASVDRLLETIDDLTSAGIQQRKGGVLLCVIVVSPTSCYFGNNCSKYGSFLSEN